MAIYKSSILVDMLGEVIATSSTEATLAGAATFTGVSFDTRKYAVIVVSVYADVVSGTDGLVIEQSKDNTNWDHNDVFTIPAGAGKTFSFQPQAEYCRIVYTNGAGAQAVFRLSTMGKKNYVKPSSHRIQDNISTEDDAELVKAVLTGNDPNGVFQNVCTTIDGNLSISNNSDGLAIAKGDVSNATYIHKFGEAPDFDTGDGLVTVWDGANDGGINAMSYTYSSSANIDSISSSNAGDTGDIEVQGLDTNWDLVTQTVTLSGQTRVALTTSLIRAFRMRNVGAIDLAGDVYVYVNGAITAGVPNTPADVRAVTRIGENQTLMAVYTVPNGYTGYMRGMFASVIGASQTTNYTIVVKARASGSVFQTKHKFGLSETGTSHNQHQYIEPEVFAAKTDIELRVSVTAGAITGAKLGGGFDVVLVAD